MAIKNSIGRAAVGLVAVAGIGMSAAPMASADDPAGGSPTWKSDLRFAGVDANGRYINDVVVEGESCKREPGALNWSCEHLSDYGWSGMYGYSHTEHYNAESNPNGVEAPVSDTGYTYEIPMLITDEEVDCSTSNHVVKNIHQVGAPVGYTPAKGSVDICMTKDGWKLDKGSADGSEGVTFTPSSGDVGATVAFKNEKGPGDNYTGTKRYIPSDAPRAKSNGILPNIASVEHGAQEYGVNGIAYTGTIEVDSDDDGKMDKIINIPFENQGNKPDGTPYTEIDLLNHSYDASISHNIEWRGHPTTATSCENTPARITLWETKAAPGYQPIQGKAVICATADGWKQEVTPDGPTGSIKYDMGASLVRFASVKDVPGHAVNDITTTSYGETATIDALKNDVASNDGTLDASTLTLLNKDGKEVNSLEVKGGTYTVENGKLTFKGADGFIGEAEAVSYQVKDSTGHLLTATAQATVKDVEPKAVNDSATTKGSTPVEISPLGNDEAGSTAAPLDGNTLQLSGDSNGTWSWDATTGKVKFLAKDGFSGEAKAEYTVKDSLGNEVKATITVQVEKADATTDPTTPPTTPTIPGSDTTTPGTGEPSTTTGQGNNKPDTTTPATPGPVIQTDMAGSPNAVVGVAGFSALAVLGGGAAALRRRVK